MTRINLLPPEIKEKAQHNSLAPWFILMAAATIIIIVGLFFFFSSQKSAKDNTLKEKQQEFAEIQKQTKPIEVFDAQQKDLNALKKIYEQSNSGRVAWAQMLNDLAMYVPEGLATASNPKAPAIWLTKVSIDAASLATTTGGTASTGSGSPIQIEGYAAPAWLCIQTWLPRASDFKSKGFLDAYPYYYYFRGHPKVAEFFVRLQNMDEWSDLWITDTKQEAVQSTRIVNSAGSGTGTGSTADSVTEETYSDWAIHFTIEGKWNPDKAVWKGASQ